MRFAPLGSGAAFALAEYSQTLPLTEACLKTAAFRFSNPVTPHQWVDVGVFTRVYVTGRSARLTEIIKVSLV